MGGLRGFQFVSGGDAEAVRQAMFMWMFLVEEG